jgi:hypothetical protein
VHPAASAWASTSAAADPASIPDIESNHSPPSTLIVRVDEVIEDFNSAMM